MPGRVVVFGAFVESPSPDGHVGQLFELPSPAEGRGNGVRCRPFRVDALPALVTVSEVLAGSVSARPGAGPPSPGPGSLCIGVGGDELLPFTIPLPGGCVVAALGGPASGKSSLLAALPGLNLSAGGWLAPGVGTDPEQYWSDAHARAVAGTLDREATALVDDIDLQSPETNARLLGLNSLGWTVIMTAGFSPALQQRVPLALNARSQGLAILLRPRSLRDGEQFGVRFEPEHSPPPGRAVVISDGRAAAVQLATVRADDGPGRAGVR
jgi:S-DNA-T family DNA segregation ATPase FtsK/SpoIIIE